MSSRASKRDPITTESDCESNSGEEGQSGPESSSGDDEDVSDTGYNGGEEDIGSDGEEVADLLSRVESDEKEEVQEFAPAPKKRKGPNNEPELDWSDDDQTPMAEFNFNSVETVFLPEDATAESVTAWDFLNVYFTDDILNLIVTETNSYAMIEIQKNSPFTRKTRLRFWKPVELSEMKKFLGLCILTGIMKLPRLSFYWSKGIYANRSFPSVMSGNRFNLILHMLHFSKDDARSTGDPLAKVRNLSEELRTKFSEVKHPAKELALDESMVSWRGRLAFRQYIKNKKHKYGIKIYKLCNAEGYVLNYIPYIGKQTVSVPKGESVTAEVVMKLMEKYLGCGHELYMDNYYNSVKLGLKLLENKTHMVGTLRANRKLNPKMIVQQKIKKGEVTWKRHKSIFVCKWKDTKEVLIISTKHLHNMVETTNKRGQKRMKPVSVRDYNTFMGGVDRSDLLCSYTAIIRRTLKWYRRYFFFLLDTSIVNAYIVAKEVNEAKYGKYDITDFREEIVMNLCPEVNATQQKPVQTVTQHYLELIPQTGKKKNPTKRCKECKKRESRYFCPECSVCPALCVTPCFKNWHLK